jgi:hypothetical protein
MANINGAFGLRPIGKVGQNTNSTGSTEYRIAAGNTNAIYQGHRHRWCSCGRHGRSVGRVPRLRVRFGNNR